MNGRGAPGKAANRIDGRKARRILPAQRGVFDTADLCLLVEDPGNGRRRRRPRSESRACPSIYEYLSLPNVGAKGSPRLLASVPYGDRGSGRTTLHRTEAPSRIRSIRPSLIMRSATSPCVTGGGKPTSAATDELTASCLRRAAILASSTRSSSVRGSHAVPASPIACIASG